MSHEETLDAHSVLRAVRGRSAKITSVVPESGEGPIDVIHISSLIELIKYIGYLKHTYNGHVYFRGQQEVYAASLIPSRLRESSSLAARASAGHELNLLISDSTSWACKHDGHSPANCPEVSPNRAGGWLPGGIPRYAVEGLLQHYGIPTRWIDAVDNLTIALWFACHHIVTHGRHAHLVRESLSESVMQLSEDDDGNYSISDEKPVYVVCIFATGTPRESQRGLMKFENSSVIDLRRAAPSYFTRPHAQHGLLMRARNDDPTNLEHLVFQVSLHDALTWLGSGTALSSYGLFPPATDDDGYMQLLDRPLPPNYERMVRRHLLIYGPGT